MQKKKQPGSLSARRAWIEIRDADGAYLVDSSLSARRAWIEMVKLFRQNYECFVALRKESVDRNLSMGLDGRFKLVALRKESVDRNLWWGVRKAVGSLVALRKESVDRNYWPDL